MKPLDKRTRQGLQKIAQKLRTQDYVEQPYSKWVVALLDWCAANDIDITMRVKTKNVHFDRALLKAIDAVLLSANLPAIHCTLSGLSSSEQAALGNQEDKSHRIAPRTHRVLLNIPTISLEWGMQQSRYFLDIDWRDLPLATFDVLLQIENLDSFYDFNPDDISILNNYAQPLIAYRGDRLYASGFSALYSAWQMTEKPHLYFGDFDAKGISIALDSRATHLLLPDLAVLQRLANAQHLPAKQFPLQARLHHHQTTLANGHPLHPYLNIILKEQRGLLQQWFTAPWNLVLLQ